LYYTSNFTMDECKGKFIPVHAVKVKGKGKVIPLQARCGPEGG